MDANTVRNGRRGMTLSDTAQTFARECLGWEDAIPDSQLPEKYIRKASNPLAEFAYTDLGAVMEAARCWHRSRMLFLAVYCYPEIDGFSVAVFNARFTVDCENKDLRVALMAGCVTAASRLEPLVVS
jgi:hypothetical protein